MRYSSGIVNLEGLLRLAVRTSPSHGENRGSIPLGGAFFFLLEILLKNLFPQLFTFSIRLL